MKTAMTAWTAPSGTYPPYFNATQDGEEVVITVRAAPTQLDGVYFCANPGDAGPGRCVAGGPTCNNYCNMAPEKGPMADAPLPCTHIKEGAHASCRVPLSVLHELASQLTGQLAP